MKRAIIIVLAAAAMALNAVSCTNSGTGEAGTYAQWIKACTGRFVTGDADIRVEFTTPVGSSEKAQENVDELLTFSPAIDGKAYWETPSMLVFKPAEAALKSGRQYTARLKLGKIVSGQPEDFRFSFTVAPKSAMLTIDNIAITSEAQNCADVYGTLLFSEPADVEKVNDEIIKWDKDGGYAEITPTSDPAAYGFRIYGITRSSRDEEIEITAATSPLGFKGKVRATATIPGSGNFHVTDGYLYEGEEPVIVLTFSEPLDANQDLNGLVELSGGAGKTFFQRNGNIVRAYYERKNSNNVRVTVSSGIRDCNGNNLGEDWTREFNDNEAAPAIKIPVDGSILPDASNLKIPFRAVCLSAVDVSVVKIYETNILSFLQTNDLDGTYQLRRSGRLIYRNTIRLDEDPDVDLHKWQNFAVDLSGLFKQEPGAIYRIRFSFRQDYSLWGKDNLFINTGGNTMVNVGSGLMTAEDESVWDEPSPYFYEDSGYDWEKYNWADRDNPATPSYYMESSRFPDINVVASDLGIIAKASDGKKLWVAVSDIMSADPVGGAEVKAYNYQLKEIGGARTDASGLAEIETSGKAFVVVAKKGRSTSYLKVADGGENSLSRFDTGGKEVGNGLKGFIYGERGVWRPGDTVHLTLIVQDREGRLPDNHPVTLEVYTPQGQFYCKLVDTEGRDGFHVFDIKTLDTDPTGIWNAYFKVGGSTFHKSLNIETVKANRLKIKLTKGSDILTAGEPADFSVAANWLTGPAADGLQAEVKMTLTKRNAAFKGYDGFTFNNPAVEFKGSEWTILQKKTDGNGIAQANVSMPQAKTAPGMLNANIVCTVMENGGDSSIYTESALFSPFGAYVGVKLGDGFEETDKDLNFKVVTVDKKGNKLSGRRLEYKIWKIDWSWWWEENAEDLGAYVNSSSATPVASGTVDCNGETSIPFRINYPEWGRYLIYVKDTESGHASGGTVLIDWPAWRGRSDKGNPYDVTMLQFSTDKQEYCVGEEATVFIPASDGGRALVSIENGSGVISREWVKASRERDTRFKLKVTPEMAPNFYIHVTMVQPHTKVAADLPIRLYGVRSVTVSDPESHLNPVIDVPEVIRPQEQFTVRVSERSRRPMTYTLAIVDEGLLDLTNYKTPDPWNEMYAKEALGVRTWDLYDDIIGAFCGRFAATAGIGGDENLVTGNRKENRFNPVVEFLGPFTLKKGTDTHTIKLPMYVGSVRVMVVAGKDCAYGKAEKTVPVRAPLMVLPTLPRALGCCEEVTLPVNVFAMENSVRNVSVNVSVEGPVQIKGSAKQALAFTENGDRMSRFTLVTGSAGGKAKVTVTATGGGYTASETIFIDVRNANPAVTLTKSASVKAGGSASFEWGAFDASEDNRAVLELASVPTIDYAGTFEYMNGYEYSCTEQLSSKAMNFLYTAGLIDSEDAGKAKAAIPGILSELYKRQLPDGGFAYWSGAAHSNEWVSSMAGQVLTEAKAQGYQVSDAVVGQWNSYQKKCVRNYRQNDRYDLGDLQQAYRLYTLALASDADAGAMNRLKEAQNTSVQARWRLAAAYAVCGKKNIAEEIIKDITADVKDCPEGRAGTFWSRLRDKAMILETLVLAGENARAMDLAREVAGDFSNEWHSTQDIAFVSVAMKALADRFTAGAIQAVVSQKEDRDINSTDAVRKVALDPSAGVVTVSNKSEGALFANLVTRNRPACTEKVAAKSEGVSLSVAYTDGNGNKLSPAQLRQGDEFTVSITVANTTAATSLSNLALSFNAASGWEIFNSRLFSAADTATEACTHKDIRDDKVIWYFDLPSGARKSFSVKCRAAYEGTFVLPAATCEAMYDGNVSANTENGIVKVVQ